ncbi:MAG TPA: DUF1289 domain-containing protein [Nitrospiraceae bacterium]|nr:DUF1289 domain-containing protein [Nitrospiraceae bacterium]
MPQDSDRADIAGPPSPCINVCSLDPAGYCMGCLRTLDEIARWSTMGAQAQWQVIASLQERRKQRASVETERAGGAGAESGST